MNTDVEPSRPNADFSFHPSFRTYQTNKALHNLLSLFITMMLFRRTLGPKKVHKRRVELCSSFGEVLWQQLPQFSNF